MPAAAATSSTDVAAYPRSANRRVAARSMRARRSDRERRSRGGPGAIRPDVTSEYTCGYPPGTGGAQEARLQGRGLSPLLAEPVSRMKAWAAMSREHGAHMAS